MQFCQVQDWVSKGMFSPQALSIPPAANLTPSYVLFSIGNLMPLFNAVWPQCWSKYKVCSKNWVFAVTYLEIIGIICGQILVGLIGDGLVLLPAVNCIKTNPAQVLAVAGV